LHKQIASNAWLVRTDLVSLWQLLAAHGIELSAQFILYPNPYPKPAQMGRRWPAHPVFPLLLGLSPYLEVRSNWRPYVEEWALVAEMLGAASRPVELFRPSRVVTAFERKYHSDRQPLYRWRSRARFPQTHQR
jgi:tRNA G46 methylase TrmB